MGPSTKFAYLGPFSWGVESRALFGFDCIFGGGKWIWPILGVTGHDLCSFLGCQVWTGPVLGVRSLIFESILEALDLELFWLVRR